MTLVLTIATSDLRRLCGIDASDTSFDSALAAVATAEQPALEYVLNAATLSGSSGNLRSLLTLGVTEQIAGSYLQQLARAPEAVGNIVLGPITLLAPSSAQFQRMGDALVLKGTNRLAPYTTALTTAAQLAAAKLTTAQAAAADAAALADAKKAKLQADAAVASDLTAAKLAIAQGEAEKYSSDYISTNTALSATDTSSVFDNDHDGGGRE